MRSLKTLSVFALLATAAGCTKDASPTPEAIIETGYFECAAPAMGCDGVMTCNDADGAAICVQAQPDACNDALTCACVGDWLCQDLPCADVEGGVICGEVEAPPPPAGCLRVDGAIDLGEQLLFDGAGAMLTIRAECDAEIETVTLLPDGPLGTRIIDGPQGPLAAGESVQYFIAFAPPEAPGPVSATVRVNDDPALDTVVSVDFVRPAGGPCLQLFIADLDLGRLGPGAQTIFEISGEATCSGVVTPRVELDPAGIVDIEVDLGAIEPGPIEFEVRATPVAEGPFNGRIVFEGVGQPIELNIRGESSDVRPLDCPDIACPEEQICSATGNCVDPIEFAFEEVADANPSWFAIPRGRYFEAVTIRPAGDDGFDMLAFMPCDACVAGPECGQEPERVARVGQAAPLIWDGVWWRTDTMGDDCSRPEELAPGDYVAVFCVSAEVELEGPIEEDGTAPGSIIDPVCLNPVPFTWPLAERRITVEVPILD